MIKTDNKYFLPESWMFTKFREIASITDRDHRTPKYTTKGIPLISPALFIENGIDISKAKLVGNYELVSCQL